MTTVKRKFILISSFLLVFVLGSATLSFAENTLAFEFDSPGELTGWNTFNIPAAMVMDGKLTVKWKSSSRLVSPSGLGVTSFKVLKVRARSEVDRLARLRIHSGNTNTLYIKHFWLAGGDKFRNYNFYINNIFPDDDHIDAFAFDLRRSGIVEIDYIRFSDPKGLGFAAAIWNEFWTPNIVLKDMVNSVDFPAIGSTSLVTAFYLFILILFIVLMAALIIKKGSFNKNAVVLAVTITFLAAASIFTMKMDYKFLRIWQRDLRIFSPMEPDRRLTKFVEEDLNDFLDFLEFIKAELPEGETIRPTAKAVDTLTELAQFRLLPIKTSNKAKYLWSYNEKDIHYKKKERQLMDGEKVIAVPVDLVSTYRNYGALYKIVKR